MATSSRYVQLSSSVLMEYIYSDQSQINVPGNVFRLNTANVPIWLMENDHTGIPQILNADSEETLIPNLPDGTANARNRSFASLSETEGALLDIDKLVVYNDYDTALTNTGSLPISFTIPQAPVYDTIRLHLVQGFNFENNDGLTLSVEIEKKSGGLLNLLNLVYNKTDVWQTLNPSPFFFGGKVYASYLEVRVLSTYNLIYDYWLGVLTGDTVVEKITANDGVKRDQNIQVNFSWIKKRSVIDEQEYITFYDGTSLDLPVRDQFESVSAVIQESTGGDYIEFYPAYNGVIAEDFINDLNRSGYDFIVLHDLAVFEYVYDGAGGYQWIKTEDLQLSQTTDYDQPNVYRPVIKNASAISFRIDYTARLYNRLDNTQIWKASSIVSNSAAKYGRRLQKINLGSNPVQTKIYNQNVIKDISINRIQEPVLNNTKFVTSFINSNAISISYETVNPTQNQRRTAIPAENRSTAQNNTSTPPTVYQNGLARVIIPNDTTYLKFSLYQKTNNINTPVNASGLGEFILGFKSNLGEDRLVSEVPADFASKSNGEIVFRLSSGESADILKYENRSFTISMINDKGEKTLLYSGKFFSVEEYQNLREIDKITGYLGQIDDLSDLLSASQSMVQVQKETINRLIDQNKALSDLDDNEKVKALNETINDLNSQVNRLSKELQTIIDQINSDNGVNLTSENSKTLRDILAANNKLEANKKGEGNAESKANKNKTNIKNTKRS